MRNFSFSNSICENFLVGLVSTTDHSSTDFFSSIYASFLHFVQVPNFLNLWDHKVGSSSELWYQSSLHFLVMNSLLYSFWGIVYITVISLCIFWVLYEDDCITFNGINTKNFIFLVSLWFLSPSFVICNVLCLRTKVLNSVAISWGCMSWYTCCWTKESK